MRQKTLSALCLILLLALSLLAVPAAAGEGFDASAMRLARFEGDVQILDAEGVPRFVLENVRFASGETLLTGEASLASVSLDDSKIVTLDHDTRVEFVQEAEHILLNLTEGSSFEGAISGEITNAKGETVSTGVGEVSVTLDATSTWTLTADTYITGFDGDIANVNANGHTLYVNGEAVAQ